MIHRPKKESFNLHFEHTKLSVLFATHGKHKNLEQEEEIRMNISNEIVQLWNHPMLRLEY